jgi:hypothetical protein
VRAMSRFLCGSEGETIRKPGTEATVADTLPASMTWRRDEHVSRQGARVVRTIGVGAQSQHRCHRQDAAGDKLIRDAGGENGFPPAGRRAEHRPRGAPATPQRAADASHCSAVNRLGAAAAAAGLPSLTAANSGTDERTRLRPSLHSDPALWPRIWPRYATLSRSRSEQGSISTTIFLMATLGALRRPTAVILMNPAEAIFGAVHARSGWARPLGLSGSPPPAGGAQ